MSIKLLKILRYLFTFVPIPIRPLPIHPHSFQSTPIPISIDIIPTNYPINKTVPILSQVKLQSVIHNSIQG